MLTTPPCGFHGTSRYNILFQIAPNDRDDDDNEKMKGAMIMMIVVMVIFAKGIAWKIKLGSP